MQKYIHTKCKMEKMSVKINQFTLHLSLYVTVVYRHIFSYRPLSSGSSAGTADLTGALGCDADDAADTCVRVLGFAGGRPWPRRLGPGLGFVVLVLTSDLASFNINACPRPDVQAFQGWEKKSIS